MNKQELIEKLEERKTIIGNFQGYAVWWEDVKEIFEELLDEPSSGHAEEAPRYVKNILARLRELPLHDREVWLKAIMGEFERDFSHAKWREGFEQGKFEGAIEREKVKIPQFVAEIIEYYKGQNATLYDALREKNFNKQYSEWLLNEQNAYDKVARAWVDGYEVEKEKQYLVKIKGIDPDFDILKYNLGARNWFTGSRHEYSSFRLHHTRKELEDAGFGWVFSCKGVEVEEVDE